MRRVRNWIKRGIPASILRPIFTWRSKRFAARFSKLNTEEAFTKIYKTHYWAGASVSGHGSDPARTAKISRALPSIIRKYEIRSMLDAPCGDFEWMSRVDLAGVQYTGGDIVKPLVDQLTSKYATEHRKFLALDLTNDPVPNVDLIFCRDCFIHLPFDLIRKALANFRRSGSKYLMTTTLIDWPFNFDTSVGGVRGIDFRLWPFNFPPPLELVPELDSQPAEDAVICMGLWPIQSLPER